MMFKYVSVSEWVRMALSMMGGVWLMNRHFDNYGWGLVAIGCVPPLLDAINQERAVATEEWKKKKSEIESGGLEAVQAWNRQQELEQLKQSASTGVVVIAIELFLAATGFLVYALGIFGANNLSRSLRFGEQYATFIPCNLAVMAAFVAWAIVANRRRKIARDKLLTLMKEGE